MNIKTGKMVKIKIDGKEIMAPEGENLLKAAKDNGIKIPSLCWHDKLSPTGACRLCLVKIDGVRGFTTSCTNYVKEGMEVIAFDEDLETERANILDLLSSEHNFDEDGRYHDEFKELLVRYDLIDPSKRRFPSIWKELNYPIDESSPVFTYDATKCIKCFRCIKACDEIQGKNVLSFTNRGITTYIVAGLGVWKESECDGCGECIQLCPTGAIVEKDFTQKVNVDNIDKKIKTTCTYCGVGCQIDMWIQDNKIVRSTGNNSMPNMGRLCVKGRFGYEFVNNKDRLTKPLIKKNGKFEESTWDEAYRLIEKKFKENLEKYGPRSFGFFSSAKCTNEENYLMMKFARAVIGTNSVDHCSRLCHASTVTAMKKTIGSGAMGSSVPEFEITDVLIVIGSNPVETHPVSATYVKKGARNGTKIIVIDPKKTPLVRYSYKWLKQKGGTDVALISGLIHVVIKKGLIDKDFINNRVEGGMDAFEELKKSVEKFTPEYVEQITGVDKDDIINVAELYGKADKASIVTGMGMSQSAHGTANVTGLINLALITGNFGREGTGVNPLRGQNNVQGASDMGALYNVYSGYQSVTDEKIRHQFAEGWNVPYEKLDPKLGLSTTEMTRAAYDGNIKVLWVMGENPVMTDPDMKHTIAALNNLDFFVVQDIFMTPTAELADVVLPASAFAEKEGTFCNTDRRVLRVRKCVDMSGDAREDWVIIRDIANQMGQDWDYREPKDIFNEMRTVTPTFKGISYERIEDEGLQWPCPTEDHPGTPLLHVDSFPIGKGRLVPTVYIEDEEQPDDEYPFMLNTGRTLYQYHTATMTRRSTPLNEYIPNSFLEMNPADIERYKLKDGEVVKLVSKRGEITVPVKESVNVGIGELFLPFHFEESPANMLTKDIIDPESKIPRYKQSACRVEKIK